MHQFWQSVIVPKALKLRGVEPWFHSLLKLLAISTPIALDRQNFSCNMVNPHLQKGVVLEWELKGWKMSSSISPVWAPGDPATVNHTGMYNLNNTLTAGLIFCMNWLIVMNIPIKLAIAFGFTYKDWPFRMDVAYLAVGLWLSLHPSSKFLLPIYHGYFCNLWGSGTNSNILL